MICGHCGKGVHEAFKGFHLGWYVDTKGYDVVLGMEVMNCPECKNLIAFIGQIAGSKTADKITLMTRLLVFPVVKTTRKRPPQDVPAEFANDYYEACLVLNDSSKASAALSRRCLQNVLHNKLTIKKRNLNDEIDEWIAKGGLPTNLVESLHALRVIGNFAAHPTKIENSGEIVDVEAGEAEWSLDTLELVFDHCFVQSAELQRRKDALNAKLTAAGRPNV
jgi:hypothetical protein